MRIDLHNHSKYSDGLYSVKEVIEIAKKEHVDVLALTDHESLQSYVRAEQYLDKLIKDNEELSSFKLIRGNEIYIARSDMSASSYKSGDKFYHFINFILILHKFLWLY